MYNMVIKSIFTAVVATLLVSCFTPSCSGGDFTDSVDMRIGTGGHGHVFMGANVPFGMVQVGPSQLGKGWDWCSGYHESDSTIVGFAHTHLSGTGIGDLGDVIFMPYTGNGVRTPDGRLYSTFSHSSEQMSPGAYAVTLDTYGIRAELTATCRVGFHRYKFTDVDTARLSVDLTNGIGWDSLVSKSLKVDGPRSISGFRRSTGWAKEQKIYFVARFSEPILTVDTLRGELSFLLPRNKSLQAEVAISYNSVEGARCNLEEEARDVSFNAVKREAQRQWNAELSKIDIQTTDEHTRKIFYTALYHTMIAPSVFSDCDAPKTTYTTFSLWDTYRAAHPLMTIIHPEKMADMVGTMLDICDAQGRLPVWHLVGNETDCMVGNPAIPVVADAVLKGCEGVDAERAYKALKRTAMCDDRGQKQRRELGYIPCDEFKESVSMDLEYALADWCVAQVAKKLGRSEDFDYFLNRSRSYARHFDRGDNFMKGVDSKGRFREPFSPFESIHMESDFTEGNGWQYTWLVPHDVEGLIALFGSKERFTAKLDSLFTVSGDMGARASADISGLIGQYAHGNEPSHHIMYLYSQIGQRYKAAERVREVLSTLYHDAPDGLSGNEDAGQMSAWYLLSSMGLYQSEPAGGRFYFGSPIIERATIRVAGGSFTIRAENNSPDNIYIERVLLNGEDYMKDYIDYADIVAGGELTFIMTNRLK